MAIASGERRIVSVLLADIAGSTSIAERLGPERSKFLSDEVVRLMAVDVERFGGTVAQLTGDGLYALFGAPNAHEDDAERAVRAALAVRTSLATYGREVGEAYGIELAGRVGVNTGPVVLLSDEAPAEERFNALGDTVNVAARLQAHAGAGGVVIGPVTARQVEDAFELEPLGPLKLKGKVEPVDAFMVACERGGGRHRVSPLVGRDGEVAVLDDVVGQLVEGRGSIVAITGEPGIGKSRLAAEARDRWREQVQFLEAHGVSYAQDVPYYPLRELLRGVLGLGVGDPEARVRLELKARLATLLGEREHAYYPFLASLLGLALEDDVQQRLRMLARDSVQRQTHEAVVELGRALARERPLCLVLDDLHFADEPTLELSEELLSLAEEEATLVLMLYRSDPDLRAWELGEAARRRYRHRFRELQLDALDPDAAARLAAAATGGEIPVQLAGRLAERTGGNPLFVEEAARDAVERGGDAAVPVAIQETLQARLDRLAPDVREVASVASVVGRMFGAPLLERLVPGERLGPALSELQRLDLVVEEQRGPAREYRFRHGLVQEAAYTSLLEQRRRELHRLVGTALEDLHGDELPEAYGLLARHFVAADEPAKAARYLLEAGDAARAVYADEQAIAHYRRAFSFLDRLGDAGRARSVLFKIALAHHLAFDFEAANGAWVEAFARTEPPPARAEPTEPLAIASFVRVKHWVPGYDLASAWRFGPNLFRGLLRIERGLDVVPDLAEQLAVAPDGCTYELRLRSGLRWSDGEPLTAADFAFTYEAMREQAVPTAHLLEDLEAEAPDARTLRLRLAEPRPYLPYLLAQLPFFPWPRHLLESLGENWRFPPALVGNGPFVLRELGEERSVLAANPHWRGSRGNVGKVTIEQRLLPEVFVEWQAGRHDVLLVHSFQVRDYGDPDTRVLPIPAQVTRYLAFPPAPPFHDLRVRQALAHGLDRELLVRESDDQPALGGFLPPAMPGHSHDLAPSHDPTRARALLAEAGYPEGRGLPELRLIHCQVEFSEASRREVEARFERGWRDLGMRVRQEWVPHRAGVDEAIRNGGLWAWGWNADYPDPHGMLGTFLESQPVGRDDDELRLLLGRARSLRSRDERLQLYRDADRRLVAEQTWVVPTMYPTWYLMHRPWVEGLWTGPLGFGTLDEVTVRR